MKSNFQEIQKINQWWLWLLLFGILLFPLTKGIQLIVSGTMPNEEPAAFIALFFVILLISSILYFIRSITLATNIDSVGIKIHFKPFDKKELKWTDIQSAKLITYTFVGYGLRYSSKYGTVYNTSGNTGLEIVLKTGRKFLIGTHKEKELNELIHTYLVNPSN